MVHLYDVVDHDELLLALNDGYIREQFHPDWPELRILNYTEKAQFERKWNTTIKRARGLIYNAATLEVLARPFPKIHNWDEAEAPSVDWDAPVFFSSNKFDGSLGIQYRLPNGRPALATRGSFASDQAGVGTQILHDSGLAWVFDEWIDSGYTPLWEIIYPDNRIVLNYAGASFIQPLGYIHMETGKYVPFGATQHVTFRDAVTDLSRENAEGWVVWFSDEKAVKIKQPDYVELHRIVTGLNRKSVWKVVSTQGYYEFNEWAEQLPDELHKWAKDVRRELLDAYSTRMLDLDILLTTVLESLGDDWQDRKLFAAAAKKIAGKDAGYMFSFLDGKDVMTKVWAELEPKGDEK